MSLGTLGNTWGSADLLISCLLLFIWSVICSPWMYNSLLGIKAVFLLMLIKSWYMKYFCCQGSYSEQETLNMICLWISSYMPSPFLLFHLYFLFNSKHNKVLLQSVIILKEAGHKCAFLKQGQEALVCNWSEFLIVSGSNTFLSTQHIVVILSMENSLLMACFMVLLIKAQVLLFSHFLQ